MNEIKLNDYLIKAGKLDYLATFQWLMDMFTIIAEDYEDEFVKVENNVFYVKLPNDENKEQIDLFVLDNDYKDAILQPQIKMYLPKDSFPGVKEDIDTTVGRFIANYVLLIRTFKGKIPYINKKFTVSYIENVYIVELLVSDDVKDKYPDRISIDEYTSFVDSVSYLTRLNKFLVHAGGPKLMKSPDGIDAYKKKLIAEAKKKYGENAMERMDVVGEIDKKLEEYEVDATKDDPTLLLEANGKSKQALKKMYAAYGHGGDFLYNDGKAHYLENSLEEGWSKDKEAIAVLYNDIRFASYSRGAETQKGGYAAKQGLRATADLKIVNEDCKSKVGLPIIITDKNKKQYIGRYVIFNNKTVLVTEENVKQFINKSVMMRSPMFCHTDTNLCSTCMGDKVKNYENGISVMVINMAGTILNASMKAMHDQSIKLVKLDLDDLI